MRLVSILARPSGRALQLAITARIEAHKFQSSPALRGGRYGQALVLLFGQVGFQSSPAPKGGRYLEEFERRGRELVSILARPEGRALLSSWAFCAGSFMFQSSPAPKGGRYEILRTVRSNSGSFNPRPPRRAGATGDRRRLEA